MTTIVSVRRGNQVALAGDGQVSLGNTVMKGNAKKVRRLYHGQVLAGFAGATDDAGYAVDARHALGGIESGIPQDLRRGKYSRRLFRCAGCESRRRSAAL